MSELRFRQVHLDFHTSEHIPGIGSEFDPDTFVSTLKAGHVDSVTLFSRCHHGWIYHDTNLPARHPHLTCNLLGEQIRACHANDIRCPIYITVGWDELSARTHPEWIELDANGRQCGPGQLQPGWRKLDMASPMTDYVIAQTQEVLDMFGDEVDGLFFDIIFVSGVHSEWSLRVFEELGLNPADETDQAKVKEVIIDRYVSRTYEAVRERNKKCGVFFNGGHVGPAFRKRLHSYSHLELESLPTGGWGYGHFPITARYARTLGKDFLGMTGKFSESWGHFNSYKPKAALEFECFSSLAMGGKCSVGDQLHPGGVLDPATYELIGSVYSQVEAKEPWCRGAHGVAEIGVFNGEAFSHMPDRLDPRNLGAMRMLTEGRHQFDLIDAESDFSPYKVIIAPDDIPIEGDLAAKLSGFLNAGGALIASGKSGLGAGLSNFPAEPVSELPYSPDFLRPASGLHSQTNTEFVMYEQGQKVKATENAEVLATLYEPYFNRSRAHFCSHNHTPVRGTEGDPGVLRKGRIVYFAHPIFTTYARHSMLFHRDIVLSALQQLLPNPMVQASGPSSLQAMVTRQDSQNRFIVHLLHYVPERRGLHFDIVEDAIPVHDVSVSVSFLATRCTLEPQGIELPLVRTAERLQVVVPKLVGHQMVVFS